MSSRDIASNESLVRQAMQAVTEHIRGNSLRVGDSLPGEGHFAAAMGVSRPVMREAFGALAALRLVDVGNGRKPRVGALDGSVMAASLDHGLMTAQVSVVEVWDVRRTMELRTAELAARSGTAAEKREILRLADAMAEQQGDQAGMSGCDIAFHQAIAQASHNALFIHILNAFEPLMAVAIPAAWTTRTTPEQREKVVANHRALARAIADGDPQGAIQAMEAHFDTAVGEILRGALEAENLRVA